MPSCSPVSEMTRISGTRILSLTRTLGLRRLTSLRLLLLLAIAGLSLLIAVVTVEERIFRCMLAENRPVLPENGNGANRYSRLRSIP